jgi:hypothetical protein
MKISTITDPGKVFDILPYLQFLIIFKARFPGGIVPMTKIETWNPVLIFKSAPGASQGKGSSTPSSSSLIV